ncbi:MAG TPA: hypothetical protein VGH23_19675 [Rhizomicrobium sp.]
MKTKLTSLVARILKGRPVASISFDFSQERLDGDRFGPGSPWGAALNYTAGGAA